MQPPDRMPSPAPRSDSQVLGGVLLIMLGASVGGLAVGVLYGAVRDVSPWPGFAFGLVVVTGSFFVGRHFRRVAQRRAASSTDLDR